MIAELAAAAAGIAGIVAWIFAFRARGESRAALVMANAAADRARIADARADAAQAKAQDAEASRVAAGVELKATETARATLAAELEAERRGKRDLLAKLAASGVPVGPVLVDDAIDRLYAHGRKNDRGPATGDKDRPGGSVSDDTSDFAELPTPPSRPR